MAMANLASVTCQSWGIGSEVAVVVKFNPVSSVIVPSQSHEGGWLFLREGNIKPTQNVVDHPGTNVFYFLFIGDKTPKEQSGLLQII